MSISSLLESVLEVLKTDPRLVSQDGDLLKNKAQELAYQLDPTIIGLLLKNDLTKSRFFKEIEGCLIFDQHAFVSFVMNKEFLPDSYTSYKNKIGLNIDGKTLDERKEVSLVWAYKDCVLAWGQDKEDSKRDEIFYNETLWSDQIDRLLDPKVFTGFKRIDIDGKHDLESFRKDENGNITDNLIIKGNNLLALHSLKKKFKWQVKLIYIDPPYNTNTDEFRYNDRFNHSTWLTFMKNRLEIARELLREDGVIFVSINDNEHAYLSIVMDQIFGGTNFINNITVKTKSPSWFKTVNLWVFETAEYLLLYGKDKNKWNYKTQYVESPYDTNYKYQIIDKNLPYKEWKIDNIEHIIAIQEWFDDVKKAKKALWKWVFLEKQTDYAKSNADSIFRFTEINVDAWKETIDAKKQSKSNPGQVLCVSRDWKDSRYILDEKEIYFYSKKIRNLYGKDVPTMLLSNIWTDIAYEWIANEGGVTLKKWKKPEKFINRIIEMATNEGDLVLDFFWWSGTTGAVAHKMKRQYILTEQMDYIHDLPEQRLINVINGDTTGITGSVGWKWGWDFVYMEIACNAERYIEMIRDAQNTDILLAIWAELKTKSFVNHKLDPKSIDNTLEVFKTLSFSDQQKTLIDLIDKNALYKNLSEMDDTTSEVSESDKKLNRDFYNQ